MAPIRPTKHSRAVRSAKDPRGIYAPPTTPSFPSSTTSTTTRALEEPTEYSAQDDFATFKTTKKDKQSIRHQALLAKARASQPGGASKVLKRRRAGKKLKTGLGSLAEALEDVEGDDGGDRAEGGEWEGIDEEEMGSEAAAAAVPPGLRKRPRNAGVRGGVGGGVGGKKMVMKSLRHNPGALKRKGVMEERERERFARNLAEMVGSAPVGNARVAGGDGVGGDGVGEDGVGGDRDGDRDGGQGERWAALRRFIGGSLEMSGAFKAVK
ncbi:hypothetical protein LTR62_004831 [Meristemomyces frigidus]|uniref:Ribosome biogenesis protein SLX9 n=1 Tax=Meristemomyces frigidus TaxID=1508187 RepID=A0AAN7TDX7_9PEZI|nr:hypothetical protein LTR62_004831 [Meristemomyces frigidus]